MLNCLLRNQVSQNLERGRWFLWGGLGSGSFFITLLSFSVRWRLVIGFSFRSLESLVGRQVGLFMRFQIVRPVGTVAAALMVTVVCPESLVDRQVDLFVPFQVTRLVGAVVAALIITPVHPGSLVGRQVGLFVPF